MALGTNNINSTTLVHEQDNNPDIIYDFSTLRDELDDGSSIEDDNDTTLVFELAEDDDDALDFEFATDTELLSSNTFEEEAFGVKRAGNPIKRGNNGRQAQPTLWSKDPFAPDSSSKDSKSSKIDNRLKKMPYRSNVPPPPSNREISAGISFASILSGKPPQNASTTTSLDDTTLDEDVPNNSAPTVVPPSSTLTATTVVSTSELESTQVTTLPQHESNGQPQPSIDHHQSQPIMYSLTDIEAKMVQQQAPKKNLLYQLLPALAPQEQEQQQQPSPSQQAPVDINSFFQKHQQQQQQQQQQTQHQPPIHKPNLTPEQELKQKEEDKGKSSYDGLMTTKNVEFINHLEQSQLATSTGNSSGDFYYEMYQANNNGGHPQQPFIHHQQQPPMNHPHHHHQHHQQGQSIDTGAELDKIIHDIVKNSSGTKDEKTPKEDGSKPTIQSKGDKKEQRGSKNDRQHLLKTIESIYFLIFEVEQSCRQPSPYENSQHSVLSTTTSRQETIDKIWNMLTVGQSPPTVISILSVNKGMSLIARLLPHLDDNQRLILMTTIAYYFVDLLPSLPSDGTHISKQQQQQWQNVDYLHPSITGCLENTLLCASLSYVSHVLSSVSNHPDFKNLISTVTGHRFVGSLLFHARGKQQQQQQQQQQQPIPDADIEQWRATFDSLFNHTMAHSILIRDKAHVDNIGLWMLLNSMAGCCNDQQKEQMANEFREPLSVAMTTLSDMTRNHPLPYLPYPIQAVYPVINELWTQLDISNP